MKREYLTNTENSIQNFHHGAEEFKRYIDDSLSHLQHTIEVASQEIDYFNKLRAAIDNTINRSDVNGSGPPPTSLPKANGIEGLDDELKRIEKQIEKDLSVD